MRGPTAAWPAIAAASLCAAAAGTVAFTLATIATLHVPLPYWDEWYNVIHFQKLAGGSYGLGDLTAQHNEHRLLFPRVVFFVDERLFGLSGRFDAAVTVALQLGNAALLVSWMRRLVARPAHRALLAGFVALMLFTLRQEENLTNGFQVQFVGVFTAAALAGSAYASALGRLEEGRPGAGLRFALAALGCAVATYTMANGVLAGGALAAVAVIRRAPWRVVAATAALEAAIAALFFHGYVAGGSSFPLSYAFAHPMPYLRYLTAYLGNPIGTDLRADQAFGTLGLALAAAGAGRLWTGAARDDASVKLYALAAFVLASAAATAYGRIALGAAQAMDSRYATPASLFWCAIVLFWFPVATASPRRGAWGAALGAALGGVVAALAVAALAAEATAWPALAERSTALRRVSDSLISGLYDAEAAGTYENTPPDDVATFTPFLREHRLAAFADPVAAARGRPLATLGPVEEHPTCRGTATARADGALGPRGVRLEGAAWDEAAGRAPRRIVLADAGGDVVGFGSASLPSQPPRRWWGYAEAQAGAELQAYAQLADGSLCRLQTATVQ